MKRNSDWVTVVICVVALIIAVVALWQGSFAYALGALALLVFFGLCALVHRKKNLSANFTLTKWFTFSIEAKDDS